MQVPPFNSRGCGEQATCIDAFFDPKGMLDPSGACRYAYVNGQRFLYCRFCVEWPRPGSTCAFASEAGSAPSPPPSRRRKQAPSSSSEPGVDKICSSDRVGTAIEGAGGVPIPGGINVVDNWQQGPSKRYCQWVRWAENDMADATVEFSIKNGDKVCAVRGEPDLVLGGNVPPLDTCLCNVASGLHSWASSSLTRLHPTRVVFADKVLPLTVRGMSATCQEPRPLSPSTAAGCMDNDGSVYNE